MSGFGAPDFTPTPTPDFARSTRLPGTTLPPLMCSSIEGRGHDQKVVVFARGQPLVGVERPGEGRRDLVPGGLFEFRHQFAIRLFGGLRRKHPDLRRMARHAGDGQGHCGCDRRRERWSMVHGASPLIASSVTRLFALSSSRAWCLSPPVPDAACEFRPEYFLPSASFANADSRFFDDGCPLVHFGLEKCRELRRRRANHHDAELLEPLPGRWIGSAPPRYRRAAFARPRGRSSLGQKKHTRRRRRSRARRPPRSAAIPELPACAWLWLLRARAACRRWMSGSTAPILLNITSTRPGMRSLRAGPAPR